MMVAGPCSVESEEQITEIAKEVQKAGAGFLRGGAFKPRTSPYAFQGPKIRRAGAFEAGPQGNGAAHRNRADGAA